MLHGPLVILHAVINEGVASVQDNVIFYNIFPIVSSSLKGNQASSTFLELTPPTEEAFIELLTMTPNLFPPRSLGARRSSRYRWSGDYFCSLHHHTLIHVIAHPSSCCSVPVVPLNPADSWRRQPVLAFGWCDGEGHRGRTQLQGGHPGAARPSPGSGSHWLSTAQAGSLQGMQWGGPALNVSYGFRQLCCISHQPNKESSSKYQHASHGTLGRLNTSTVCTDFHYWLVSMQKRNYLIINNPLGFKLW